MHSLASIGLRLHGFGVKAGGLVRYADCLASADSLAWSFEARRSAQLDAFDAGEVSLVLGMHGLPSLDPWEPPAPARDWTLRRAS